MAINGPLSNLNKETELLLLLTSFIQPDLVFMLVNFTILFGPKWLHSYNVSPAHSPIHIHTHIHAHTNGSELPRKVLPQPSGQERSSDWWTTPSTSWAAAAPKPPKNLYWVSPVRKENPVLFCFDFPPSPMSSGDLNHINPPLEVYLAKVDPHYFLLAPDLLVQCQS